MDMKRILAGVGVVALVAVVGIGTAKAVMSEKEAGHGAPAAQAHAPAAGEHGAAPATEHASATHEPAQASGHSGPHWDYEGSGGPQDWGKLNEASAKCGSGAEQSPVDLTGGVDAEVSNIALHWNPANWNVVNNGHTIQVEGKDGGYATIDGERYDLVQFHFHTPSEHKIDGRNYPMEVHFVHKSAEGKLAVIGVMMMAGGENALFSSIMEKAPAKEGSAQGGTIDQRGLISPINGVYRYQGSLTTPPCSETVLWTVLQIPVLVSQEDITKFQGLFPMNARPIQALNRRYVLRD